MNGRLYDHDLARAGVQADCNVTEEAPRELGQAPETTVVPACDTTGGATPCWRVAADPRCAGAPESMAVVIDRGGVVPSPNTRAQWSCLVCVAGDADPACVR